MLKVYCDFNDRTADDRYWILWFEGQPLAGQLTTLGLQEGDRVTLHQDDDFEVEATLLFDQTTEMGASPVCARPDWSTRRDA
jgi:hypothetical protein